MRLQFADDLSGSYLAYSRSWWRVRIGCAVETALFLEIGVEFLTGVVK
jgi:hypothetical protein